MHNAGVESASTTWKLEKNIRKRRRQSGLKYVNTHGIVVAKKVLKATTCICPRKCRSKVPDEEQSVIFSNFRSMGSRNTQAAFIAGHVVSCEKKGCIKQTQQSDPGRYRVRKHSFKYYLTLSDKNALKFYNMFFTDTLPIGRTCCKDCCGWNGWTRLSRQEAIQQKAEKRIKNNTNTKQEHNTSTHT